MERARYDAHGSGTVREESTRPDRLGIRLVPVRDLTSMHVRGTNGERIGRVHEVFVDADSLLVNYLSISIGAFGRSQALVPVSALSITEDDHGLYAVAPFSQEHLRHAPSVDDDELTLAMEDEIAAYYRDADQWERNRQAVRARQATPAPTPEIAAADLAASEHRDDQFDSRVSRREL
jgi:sporulation protein YlmC with PRC-barrel domain